MGLPRKKSKQLFQPRQIITDKGVIDNPEYNEWPSYFNPKKRTLSNKKNLLTGKQIAEQVTRYLVIAFEVLWIIAKVLCVIISVLILLVTGLGIGDRKR